MEGASCAVHLALAGSCAPQSLPLKNAALGLLVGSNETRRPPLSFFSEAKNS